jgi:hypothetical protein
VVGSTATIAKIQDLQDVNDDEGGKDSPKYLKEKVILVVAFVYGMRICFCSSSKGWDSGGGGGNFHAAGKSLKRSSLSCCSFLPLLPSDEPKSNR